jgi:hypothetical protein
MGVHFLCMGLLGLDIVKCCFSLKNPLFNLYVIVGAEVITIWRNGKSTNNIKIIETNLTRVGSLSDLVPMSQKPFFFVTDGQPK